MAQPRGCRGVLDKLTVLGILSNTDLNTFLSESEYVYVLTDIDNN